MFGKVGMEEEEEYRGRRLTTAYLPGIVAPLVVSCVHKSVWDQQTDEQSRSRLQPFWLHKHVIGAKPVFVFTIHGRAFRGSHNVRTLSRKWRSES